MSINKQALKENKIPQNNLHRFSVVGNEETLTKSLIGKYSLGINDHKPLRLEDIFEVTHTSIYPGQHKIIDLELIDNILELQIVVSPWQSEWLYVIYDISNYETAVEPNNLWSDSFVLLVLIPLAVLVRLISATFEYRSYTYNFKTLNHACL